MAGHLMGRRVAGKLIAIIAGLAIVAAAAPPKAHAQEYPAHPISLVTGLVAGSITDVIARYLANKMGHLSGQTVLVINKSGANGIIAATEVARAKPDGYPLLWAASSSYASNQLVYKNMPYDPTKDLVLISTATRFGFMILVNDDNPATTLPELTAQLKQKGGGLYGASSTNMLAAAEMYKFSAGLDTQQVLYKSTADWCAILRASRSILPSSTRRLRSRRRRRTTCGRSQSPCPDAACSPPRFRPWKRPGSRTMR